MTEHQCNNCGNVFTSGFCNECGQPIAHRITLKHIFHEISHALMHADKGIIHLLLQLFVRPGVVAREYIVEEKRKRYFNPFQYILIVGSIAAFVAVNSHFMEQMTAITTPVKSSGRQIAFVHAASTFMSKYYNLVVLFQLPFYAFASFLIYRRYKFNYAEHLTLQTFVTAQLTVLGMLTMLIVWMLGRAGIYYSLVVSVLSAIFQIHAYTQFFGERTFKGALKAFVTNVLGFIFFFITMVSIIVVSILVMFVFLKK